MCIAVGDAKVVVKRLRERTFESMEEDETLTYIQAFIKTCDKFAADMPPAKLTACLGQERIIKH